MCVWVLIQRVIVHDVVFLSHTPESKEEKEMQKGNRERFRIKREGSRKREVG